MGTLTRIKRANAAAEHAVDGLVDGYELGRELALLQLALVGAVAEIKDYADKHGNVPTDYADALLEPVTEGLTLAAERAHKMMGAIVDAK